MSIENHFERIGAKARIRRPDLTPQRVVLPALGVARNTRDEDAVAIDIARAGRQEVFELILPERVRAVVLDVDPKDRHLLLLTKDGAEKTRYLCGHDERHWFVSPLPGTPKTVAEAKEVLKPAQVRDRQRGIRRKQRNRRRNPAFLRQGEWFFLPAPDLQVDERFLLRNEPLQSRPGGNIHRLEEAYREGGERRWLVRPLNDGQWEAFERFAFVDGRSYQPLTDDQKTEVDAGWPEGVRRIEWEPRVVNPTLYARGKVRHPEHATVVLKGWHRVFINEESGASRSAQASVRFID